jgi:hypothetical protein
MLVDRAIGAASGFVTVTGLGLTGWINRAAINRAARKPTGLCGRALAKTCRVHFAKTCACLFAIRILGGRSDIQASTRFETPPTLPTSGRSLFLLVILPLSNKRAVAVSTRHSASFAPACFCSRVLCVLCMTRVSDIVMTAHGSYKANGAQVCRGKGATQTVGDKGGAQE